MLPAQRARASERSGLAAQRTGSAGAAESSVAVGVAAAAAAAGGRGIRLRPTRQQRFELQGAARGDAVTRLPAAVAGPDLRPARQRGAMELEQRRLRRQAQVVSSFFIDECVVVKVK